MNSKPRPTIKDIARLTGLSKGTVDRVLHNRPGVAGKSYEKVMKVIEEMGYEPNLYASLLASHKERIIAVLLPESSAGDFWELYQKGIDRATGTVKPFDIGVRRIGYDQYDIDSFRDACRQVMDLEPAGVVIAPMFRNETLVFAEKLRQSGIPYVFVDSKLEEDYYTAFFGLPSYQSGYLCAYLLTDGQPVERVAIVRIRRDKARQSDPTVNRRAGFLDYMAENYPDCAIDNIFIDPNDPAGIERTVSAYYEANPETRHIAMFNSRIHLLAPFLEKHPVSGRRVVGFDNLDANVKALRAGLVTALISQHPAEQVASAIQTLSDCLVLGKTPARRDNFMHMDILTRYNVEYY